MPLLRFAKRSPSLLTNYNSLNYRGREFRSIAETCWWLPVPEYFSFFRSAAWWHLWMITWHAGMIQPWCAGDCDVSVQALVGLPLSESTNPGVFDLNAWKNWFIDCRCVVATKCSPRSNHSIRGAEFFFESCVWTLDRVRLPINLDSSLTPCRGSQSLDQRRSRRTVCRTGQHSLIISAIWLVEWRISDNCLWCALEFYAPCFMSSKYLSLNWTGISGLPSLRGVWPLTRASFILLQTTFKTPSFQQTVDSSILISFFTLFNAFPVRFRAS